jgi:hypothetical protein
MYIVVNHRCQPASSRIFTNPLDAAEELKRLERRKPFGVFSILQVAPDGDDWPQARQAL